MIANLKSFHNLKIVENVLNTADQFLPSLSLPSLFFPFFFFPSLPFPSLPSPHLLTAWSSISTKQKNIFNIKRRIIFETVTSFLSFQQLLTRQTKQHISCPVESSEVLSLSREYLKQTQTYKLGSFISMFLLDNLCTN